MIELRSFVPRAFFLALLAASIALPLAAQGDGGFGPPPGGGPPDGMDQPSSSRGPSVDRELKQLTKQLTLTSDQQAKIKPVLTERNRKIGELMRPSKPSQQSANGQTQGSQGSTADADQQGPPNSEQFEQMREQMKAIREEANTQIAALLTADQATKFHALLKQRQQRNSDDDMPPPPPDGGGGPPDGGGGPGGGGPGGGGPPSL
jgi:Spy/CpxP family protein refolding chaperone